jgi:hypothetical protein
VVSALMLGVMGLGSLRRVDPRPTARPNAPRLAGDAAFIVIHRGRSP